MKKILIVSTHTDIEQRLRRMIQDGSIPAADYSIVVEFFQEEASKPALFENVFAIDDLRNREAIQSAIETCRSWGPFDVVVATDEYAMMLAAELREKLGVRGPTVQNTLKFRDKVAMKQALEGSELRAPRLYSTQQVLADSSLLPVVIKPRTYGGSKGVRVVQTLKEFQELAPSLETRLEDSISSEFSMDDIEIEEFVEGRIFHIDGLVFEDQIIFCRASQYEGTCFDFLNGKPLGSSSVAESSEQEAWLRFASQVHGALRIPDGAFHLEAFLTTRNERVFLEIGARPGGAYTVPAIESACKVNLDVAHIQCQLGIHPEIDNQQSQHFGYLVFPREFSSNHSKTVAEVAHPDLASLSHVSWSQLPSVGDSYTGSFSYTSNLGAFVFTAPKATEVYATLSHILHGYKVYPGEVT